jgi:hypothetical protein
MTPPPQLITKDIVLANPVAPFTLAIEAEFIQFITSSGPFVVSIDDGAEAVLTQGFSYRAPPGQIFKRIGFIRNDYAGLNTVRIAYGFGEFRDARLTPVAGTTFTPTRPTEVRTYADVAIGAGLLVNVAPLLLARASCVIKNVGANVCRVGDNQSAAARGHELNPGEAVVFTATPIIYVFSTAGTTVSIVDEVY